MAIPGGAEYGEVVLPDELVLPRGQDGGDDGGVDGGGQLGERGGRDGQAGERTVLEASRVEDGAGLQPLELVPMRPHA